MLRQLAYALPSIPGIPGFDSLRPKTYAAWPVWRDSTTAKVKFMPLAKKAATKLYHKARAFERQTRQPGKQDGALGRNGLLVLHALIFDFLNYATGELDPAIETIARKACASVSSVKRGLANLKACGVLNWIRRAAETRDEKGRFCLEQDTNAYGILPASQWRSFIDDPEAPPPHPSTWGLRCDEYTARDVQKQSFVVAAQLCGTSGEGPPTAISGDLTERFACSCRRLPQIAFRKNESRMRGPELILTLLIAFVLPESGGAAVLYGPDMDLRRRPASSSAACALRAQHDDPVAVG
jgi:hypothetical protein